MARHAKTDRPSPRRDALKRVLEAAVDIIYPGGCLACQADAPLGRHLCPACSDLVLDAQLRHCPRCAARLGPHESLRKDCPTCRGRKYSFRRVVACGPYEGPLGAMVRAYKYERHIVLADTLSAWMTEMLMREQVTADLVVSVPIHPLKSFHRGLDHAGLLAAKVAARIRRPRLKRVLRQTKLGLSMVGLGFNARIRAARDAFAVRPAAALKGRSVLLVDDVLTTGATASECARLLHVAGAAAVNVLVVARQARSHEP